MCGFTRYHNAPHEACTPPSLPTPSDHGSIRRAAFLGGSHEGGGAAPRVCQNTLHPTPYPLHLTPDTLHPSPYTLQPTPHTLHPTPHTAYLRSVVRAGAGKPTPLGTTMGPRHRATVGSYGGGDSYEQGTHVGLKLQG